MVFMPDAPGRADEESPLLTTSERGPRLILTVTVIALGNMLAAFDATVVAAIRPSIGAQFEALDKTTFLATAYMLCSSAVQPVICHLSDPYGRKRCLLWAYTAFLLGAMICSISVSLSCCIVGRAIQGIGGGGLSVMGSVILSDLVPLRERGIYQGFLNTAWGLGSSMGAPIGGLIADTLGWRFAFAVQIPIILAAAITVGLCLKLDLAGSAVLEISNGRKFDYSGSMAMTAAMLSMMLGLEMEDHSSSLALLALSSLLYAAFLYIQTYTTQKPLVPKCFFTKRTTITAAMINILSSAGYFIILFNLPLFFRAVRNLSAAETGLRLASIPVGGFLASLTVGPLLYRLGRASGPAIICSVSLLAGACQVFSLGARSSLALQYLNVVPAAFGYSGLLTCTLIVLLQSAPASDRASVTGTSSLTCYLGGILGISIADRFFNGLLASRLAHFGSASVKRIVHDIDVIRDTRTFTKAQIQDILARYARTMRDVFGLSVAFSIMAVFLACTLHNRSIVVQDESSTRDVESEQR